MAWLLLIGILHCPGNYLLPIRIKKLETFDPENHTEELQEVNGVKCWDSHKVVKLELDFLKDHYMILSLSTGLFKLDEKKEKIVVAIVGDVKGDKNDDIDQHDKMINFYRNEHFGTDSLMRTKSVGALINTINLNAELNTNIVPYRLSQRKLTPDLNSFILLTNQGCKPIIHRGIKEGNDFRFMTIEQMEKYAPEFVDQYESSPALALDIRVVCEEGRTYRRTCIGYEDGHCSLYEVDIGKNGKAVVKTKFDQNYSSAVSSILFLENNELLVGAMWEGIVYYGQIESGLDNGIFVEDSNNFDAVTALCKLRRLDGQGFCCGTFGKRLMVYSVKGKKCKRVWTREFRNPILQIRSFDITGDGLQDIAVLSSGGLHLLQVNYKLVVQKVLSKIAPSSD